MQECELKRIGERDVEWNGKAAFIIKGRGRTDGLGLSSLKAWKNKVLFFFFVNLGSIALKKKRALGLS